MAGLLLVTILLGLATRRFPASFPAFIARYGGDALWASMVYWMLAFIAPRTRWTRLGALGLGIAIAVECSQLYHAPWLEQVQSTRPGALLLGQGFLWSDLACYAGGIGLAVGIDRLAGGCPRGSVGA